MGAPPSGQPPTLLSCDRTGARNQPAGDGPLPTVVPRMGPDLSDGSLRAPRPVVEEMGARAGHAMARRTGPHRAHGPEALSLGRAGRHDQPQRLRPARPRVVAARASSGGGHRAREPTRRRGGRVRPGPAPVGRAGAGRSRPRGTTGGGSGRPRTSRRRRRLRGRQRGPQGRDPSACPRRPTCRRGGRGRRRDPQGCRTTAALPPPRPPLRPDPGASRLGLLDGSRGVPGRSVVPGGPDRTARGIFSS